MDVLKVFNLIICANNGEDVSSGWFFNIMFAPIGMLLPFTRYSVLAYLSIVTFTILIYTSDLSFLKWFNSDNKGNKNLLYSLLSAFLLYMIQTTIILLFLRYNLCNRTRDWESRDYHLTLQQYNNETLEANTGGYETGY